MGLREVFADARLHNDEATAAIDLKRWIGWARRSRLDPFKRLATTLKEHFDGVVRGTLDHRSNAFVEAMNGLLQQARRAARGFRTAASFIAIAYLRLGKLTHLPVSPFVHALPLVAGSRSLSGLGIVGCETASAVHFLPGFCPIAGLWACKSGKNCPRWGRFSLSTPQVRQAPGVHRR